LNAELIGKDTITLIICYGMFHGGMIQILAGMWEVYRGNIFGGSPGLGGPGAIARGGGGLVQGHPQVPGFLCSGCGADRTHPVLLSTLLAGSARWHCSTVSLTAPMEFGLCEKLRSDLVYDAYADRLWHCSLICPGGATGCGLNPLGRDRRNIWGSSAAVSMLLLLFFTRLSDIILAVAGGATGCGLNPLGWDRRNIFGGPSSSPARLASCWGRYGLWPEPPTAGPTKHLPRVNNDLVEAVARAKQCRGLSIVRIRRLAAGIVMDQ